MLCREFVNAPRSANALLDEPAGLFLERHPARRRSCRGANTARVGERTATRDRVECARSRRYSQFSRWAGIDKQRDPLVSFSPADSHARPFRAKASATSGLILWITATPSRSTARLRRSVSNRTVFQEGTKTLPAPRGNASQPRSRTQGSSRSALVGHSGKRVKVTKTRYAPARPR